MTYLDCLAQLRQAKTPLEMSTLALQYYAEIPPHPQRMVFDKGSVAREALRRMPDDAGKQAATHLGNGSQ